MWGFLCSISWSHLLGRPVRSAITASQNLWGNFSHLQKAVENSNTHISTGRLFSQNWREGGIGPTQRESDNYEFGQRQRDADRGRIFCWSWFWQYKAQCCLLAETVILLPAIDVYLLPRCSAPLIVHKPDIIKHHKSPLFSHSMKSKLSSKPHPHCSGGWVACNSIITTNGLNNGLC